MKIFWSGSFFYIAINENCRTDYEISKYLDISIKEYRDILKICRGNESNFDLEIIFNTKEDAQKAIEILEPRYILAKLTGEIKYE